MAPSELTFTFTMKAEDLVSAKRESMDRARVFVVVAVIYFLIGSQFVSSRKDSDVGAKDYAMVVGIASVAALWSVSRYAKRLSLRESLNFATSPVLQGAQSWTLNSEGVHVVKPLAKGEYRWAAFTSIIETRSCFFLYVERRTAVFIPKSAFQTPADLADAREILHRGVGVAYEARERANGRIIGVA